MEEFYYIYILQSEKDGKTYTGYTSNLPLRFEAHQAGEVPSTKHRRPLKLIYFEGCLNQADAVKREKYLKSNYGKLFLGNRLKAYFTDQKKQIKNKIHILWNLKRTFSLQAERVLSVRT